jgi:hypothetical protein
VSCRFWSIERFIAIVCLLFASWLEPFFGASDGPSAMIKEGENTNASMSLNTKKHFSKNVNASILPPRKKDKAVFGQIFSGSLGERC